LEETQTAQVETQLCSVTKTPSLGPVPQGHRSYPSFQVNLFQAFKVHLDRFDETFQGGSGGNSQNLFVQHINVEDYQSRISVIQNDIDDRIQKLDAKLESILEKHEKDFLTAYRVITHFKP
jgi:hypothetical protein